MMADLGIAEIRAEGRKMLAKYRNADGRSTDEAKAIELWFWGWVDELLRDPEGIDEDGIEHICDALIEVGPWDEIDGDGTEASIIADHIRDLARLLDAAPVGLTEDDLAALRIVAAHLRQLGYPAMAQETDAIIARLSAAPVDDREREGEVLLDGKRYSLVVDWLPAVWDEAIRDYLPRHPIPVRLDIEDQPVPVSASVDPEEKP